MPYTYASMPTPQSTSSQTIVNAIDSLKAAIDDLDVRLAATADTAALTDRVTALEAQDATTATDITALSTRVTNLESSVTELQARRAFTPRGTWTASTAYTVDDIVLSDKSTFRVTATHTSGGVAPTALAPGANYELWASRGTGVLALPTGTAVPAGTPDGTVIYYY